MPSKLTLEDLRKLDDVAINHIVTLAIGQTPDYDKGLTPYATSWDAIIPAVREWANTSERREALSDAMQDHSLPLGDIIDSFLFAVTSRDLCHALILAAQEANDAK